MEKIGSAVSTCGVFGKTEFKILYECPLFVFVEGSERWKCQFYGIAENLTE